MKTNPRRVRPFLLAVVVAFTVPAWASAKDLTLKERISVEGSASKTRESMEYFVGNKMVTDDPHFRTITDLGAKTFTMINKDNKTYYTQTFDEIRQRMEGIKAEMKKRMEELPPQTREMMAHMMGDEGSVTLKPTGKTEKIAGYEAKEYALESGQVSGNVWVSEALQPPMKEKDAEAYGKAMGSLGGPGGKLAEAMAKLKGLPLRSTIGMSMGPHKMMTTREVTEVSEKAPPADVLEIPAGFVKMSPPAPGEGGSSPRGANPHMQSPHGQ